MTQADFEALPIEMQRAIDNNNARITADLLAKNEPEQLKIAIRWMREKGIISPSDMNVLRQYAFSKDVPGAEAIRILAALGDDNEH